jgi:beta-glucanase (GH16 family)
MNAPIARKLLALSIMAASSPLAAQSLCEWTEVWSDDFANGLDKSVWSHEVNGDGGGNAELQYYTARPENSWVADGILNIKAIREAYQGKTWTSARLRTKHAQEWTYGKIEARLKLPNGSGTWPAFWMLPTELQRDSHGWPQSGEIDIIEAVNDEEDLAGTLHYGPYWPYNGNTGWPNADNHIAAEPGRTKTEFNNYAVEWYEDRMVWLVNGQEKITITRADLDGVDAVRSNWDSFVNRHFHIILNLAIGGTLPGNPDGTEAPEQLMQVDWVKVYKNEATWSVEGDGYVYRGEHLKHYHVDAPTSGNYQWSVPAGASIVSGQDTNEIVVSYGNSAHSGDVSVSFDPGCGTRTYAKSVAVEAGTSQVITDYESGLGVTHEQNGLQQGETNPDTGQTAQFEVVSNPAPGGINQSSFVLHYQRDPSATWDNLKLSGFDPFNAGELKSGRAKLFMDVFVPQSNILLGHELDAGLENAAAVSAAPAWDGNTGRLAAFGGTISQPGEWHTVELHYGGTPDSNIGRDAGDTLVFMVDASLNVPAELYFDNPRIVWPANDYSLQSVVADFEGTADEGNLEPSPATSGNAVVVANPAPDGVNNSANVLQYSRDPGADYDTLSFNQVTGIPDALDAQHGMVRVAVDVYTDAPAGTLISLNLENESAADAAPPEDWQVGRHSFYQAQTTVSTAWETLEFNYNFMAQLGDFENNRASAPYDAVDQLIFMVTPGEPSSGTYYFDNFRVMAYNKDAPACVTDCDVSEPEANVALGASVSASTEMQPATLWMATWPRVGSRNTILTQAR